MPHFVDSSFKEVMLPGKLGVALDSISVSGYAENEQGETIATVKYAYTDGTVKFIPLNLGHNGSAIDSITINDAGHLIITYANGDTLDCGAVRDVRQVKSFNFTTRNAGVLIGDVNGDGIVSNEDVRMLAKYIEDPASTPTIDLRAADLDGDGNVTADDLELLNGITVGITSGNAIARFTIYYDDGSVENHYGVVDEPASGGNGGGGGSSYVLPVASATRLGGVKAVAKTDDMTEAVGIGGDGRLYVKPPGSGEQGVGISDIAFKTTFENGDNVYTITLTDGAQFDFTAPQGPQGVGIISVQFKNTLANGDNVYLIKLTNNRSFEFTAPRGPAGNTRNITSITCRTKTAAGYLLGDVNHDGKVDTFDLIEIGKYLDGTISTVDIEAADFDGDGVVSEDDLEKLGELIANNINQIIAKFTIRYDDGTNRTVYGFVDAALGGDGYTPQRGVDYWTEEDKNEIVSDTVAALPVYNGEVSNVLAQFQNEFNDTVSKVRQLIADEPAFVALVATDTHAKENSTGADVFTNATVPNMNALANAIPVNRIVHLGDLIDGSESKAVSINRIRDLRNRISSIGVEWRILDGNHDHNGFQGSETATTATDQYITTPELANMVSLHNDTTAPSRDVMYFCEDIAGIRVVYLSSNYQDNVGGGYGTAWGYPTAEINWVRDVALNTNKPVLFFSHMGLIGADSQYGTQPKNGVELKAVIDSWAENGGTVIGWFNGHNHWDRTKSYDYFDAVSINGNGVWNYGHTSDIPATVTDAVRWPRSLSDYTKDCIEVVVVRPRLKTVDLIRFGAGADRAFVYTENTPPAPEEPEEPAVPDEPPAPTYTNVLDTVGYTDGQYMSGTSTGSDANYTATGYIPFTKSDVLYIKGDPGWADESHCRMTTYSASKTAIKQLHSYTSITQYFDKAALGTNYIKLTPKSSGSYVLDATTAYVRMSLKGKGADLIITVNQPIEGV